MHLDYSCDLYHIPDCPSGLVRHPIVTATCNLFKYEQIISGHNLLLPLKIIVRTMSLVWYLECKQRTH